MLRVMLTACDFIKAGFYRLFNGNSYDLCLIRRGDVFRRLLTRCLSKPKKRWVEIGAVGKKPFRLDGHGFYSVICFG